MQDDRSVGRKRERYGLRIFKIICKKDVSGIIDSMENKAVRYKKGGVIEWKKD